MRFQLTCQKKGGRQKKLDDYRDYIVYLLETFPLLSAVKVQRKLQIQHPDLVLSPRTIRRYVKQLKETVVSKQMRTTSRFWIMCRVSNARLIRANYGVS
ncbi:hypothetical protein MNBD_GAMMA25-390 [hydrothermal vent metagenome]|uniref:Uncharacterized protein n=1 Tax=hydrothermal vent metagenome TaxID=652676 RepID=A0A3B1B6I9_9ZZZZ